MKHTACQKCRESQEKAGEALGLFNEAQGELLDCITLLRDLRHEITDPALLVRVEAALAAAGERQRVEAGIREIVAPS